MRTSDRSVGLHLWLRALVREAGVFIHRLRRRLRLWRMQRLEDQILDDIGVTREELDWAIRLPFRVNAALALHDRAKHRRAEEARAAAERRPVSRRASVPGSSSDRRGSARARPSISRMQASRPARPA